MLTSAQGIILKNIKFGDKAAIVKVYTLQWGIVSFIIKGAYSKNSKIKLSHILPLNIISFDTNYHSNSKLQTLQNINVEWYFQSNQFKNNIAYQVVQEVLYAILQYENVNANLYNEIADNILPKLNQEQLPYYFIPTVLKIIIQQHGFTPYLPDFQQGNIFNIAEGKFEQNINPNSNKDALEAELLHHFFSDEVMYENNLQRRQLIELLIKYIQYHIMPNFRIKALDIYESR